MKGVMIGAWIKLNCIGKYTLHPGKVSIIILDLWKQASFINSKSMNDLFTLNDLLVYKINYNNIST